MSVDIYDLNCPFCEKVYKLPRAKVVKHVGKTIYCRGCGNPFSVPPLPVFESNAGLVLESPKVIESSAAAIDPPVEAISPEIDRFTDESQESPVAATNGHQAADATSRMSSGLASGNELPPPFSADVLPPIENVLPELSDPPMVEPPDIDLAASTETSSLTDVETPPYRGSTEHGAVTVEEEASYFHDETSSEGASAGDLLEVESAVDADESAESSVERSAEISSEISSEISGEISGESSAAGFDAFAPSVEARVARKTVPAKQFVPPRIATPSFAPPKMPAGLSLDDVPIARAVASPAPPMLPLTAPLNFRSLRSRLTWLLAINVIIVLLLAAILLALLGYIPHRPA